MSKKKSWEIKGLKKHDDVYQGAKLILKQRITFLLKEIDKHFVENSEESLHQVRIAVRRVRYNMELFSNCFDRKTFMKFYKTIKDLQDLTGELRDLDVLKLNLKSLSKNNGFNHTGESFNNIDEKRTELNEKIKLELMKFKHSQVLDNFSSSL